jgi:hypothetical protein
VLSLNSWPFLINKVTAWSLVLSSMMSETILVTRVGDHVF